MKHELKMTSAEMEELIDLFDVPTKLHLQQYEDKEELKRYRILRTKAEDMVEDYELGCKVLNILKNTDVNITFIKRSDTYIEYLDKPGPYISAENYEIIKEWLQ